MNWLSAPFSGGPDAIRRSPFPCEKPGMTGVFTAELAGPGKASIAQLNRQFNKNRKRYRELAEQNCIRLTGKPNL